MGGGSFKESWRKPKKRRESGGQTLEEEKERRNSDTFLNNPEPWACLAELHSGCLVSDTSDHLNTVNQSSGKNCTFLRTFCKADEPIRTTVMCRGWNVASPESNSLEASFVPLMAVYYIPLHVTEQLCDH